MFPPNPERVAGYIQRLIGAGFVSRMQEEWLGYSHSIRVQDRSRFVTKTNMKTSRYAERMKQALNQQLQGKMSKVFFLWALCILLCCVGMGVELVYSFNKKTKVVKLKEASNRVVKLEIVLKWYRNPIQGH